MVWIRRCEWNFFESDKDLKIVLYDYDNDNIRVDIVDKETNTILDSVKCYTYHWMGDYPPFSLQLLDRRFKTIGIIKGIGKLEYGGRIE